MRIDQNATVHNRFDVEVRDAATGALKQRATGYNIILNQWFGYLAAAGVNMVDTQLAAIAIGKGTGTLSPSRTTLFSNLGYKRVTDVEVVYAYPTSYITKEMRLEASEFNGNTITEVGFMSTYMGSYYHLSTHAFLMDSEGNQIAIAKTDADVVIIRGTFYVTFTSAGFGANALYAAAEDNAVIKWLFGKAGFPGMATFGRFHTDTPAYAEYNCNGKKTVSMSDCTRKSSTWQIDYPVFIWGDTEYPNHTVKQIGMPGLAVFRFPDTTAFPPLVVSRFSVGTGDGVTTEFYIGSPMFIPDSETVYVDGTALTRDVDYTVDPNNNMIDMRENYYTAGMTALSDNVEFGNLKTQGKSSSAYKDPLAWWNCYKANQYPYECIITAAKPIWIDFGEAKGCNRMKIELNTVPSAQIDNLVIECSDDNEAWTALAATRTGQVWDFPLTSARYWQVYIPDYSWKYDLETGTNTVRDNHTFCATFFLGKVVPSLVFAVPPAAGKAIEATFTLEQPFKTTNNLLKFTCSLSFARGTGS